MQLTRLAFAAALAVSILTLFSMTKIWAEVFWKESPSRPMERQDGFEPRSTAWLFVPMIAMAAVIVLIGFAAEPVFVLANEAAKQLVDPAEYIQAVLGARP